MRQPFTSSYSSLLENGPDRVEVSPCAFWGNFEAGIAVVSATGRPIWGATFALAHAAKPPGQPRWMIYLNKSLPTLYIYQ